MLFIRSLIFNIFLITWTGIVTIFFSPTLIIPGKAVFITSYVWGRGTAIALRWICNIRIKIEGLENLPKAPFIVASKHESALETIIFFNYLKAPIYILKKELLALPIFGFYLIAMKMIYINRKDGIRSIKKVITNSKEFLKQERVLVVFPEGTRVNHGEERDLQSGIAAIYSSNSVPVIPVFLDTGIVWSRNSFIKYPGEVTIKFQPQIEPGLSKKDFMEKLKKAINNKPM